MRALAVVLVALAAGACWHAEQVATPAPANNDRQDPPPAPPPSPHRVSNLPVPSQIADFVHAHESDPGVWRVQFHEELDSTPRTALLSRPAGIELVERLMQTTSYVDGEYGCASDTMQIIITRGAATLTLGVNCGYLFLSPQGIDGPWISLASDMVTQIRDLRAHVLP